LAIQRLLVDENASLVWPFISLMSRDLVKL